MPSIRLTAAFFLALVVHAAVEKTAARLYSQGNIDFKNQCSYPISLWDMRTTCSILSGSKTKPRRNCGRRIYPTATGNYFHNSIYPNSTGSWCANSLPWTDTDIGLVSIEIGIGYYKDVIWYNISIVPPDASHCSSYASCKRATGHSGFDIPVSISPNSNLGTSGTRCQKAICANEGCTDAKKFPDDKIKTFTCPINTNFTVTFCP